MPYRTPAFRAVVGLFTLAVLAAAAPRPAAAQEATTTAMDPAAAATPPSREALEALGTASPRGAMYRFLAAAREHDYATAATHLNLNGLPAAVRAIDGADLASSFHIVLDQTLWVEWDALSDSAAGFADDGLPRGQDRLGTIRTAAGEVELLLEQATWKGGKPVWKIANETVALIPALYEEFGYGPLGRVLPRVLIERRVLDMRLWQWAGLALVLALAGLGALLFSRIVSRAVRTLMARANPAAGGGQGELSPGPARLLLFGLLLQAGLPPLALAVPVMRFLGTVATGLTIAGAIWLVMRLVDLLAAGIEARLVGRGQAIAMSVVPLGRRVTKVVLAILAVLVILQNFGFNVAGLIAGLGIGGLAFALAAQKSLENLFGGVTLIADRPVQVGDFCRFGDRVGTVEEVGLRSTRVRTLDRTVVSIPNSEFSNMQIENFARRDRIWFRAVIGVRYETTPDQMRFLLQELKKLLVGHPRVLPDPARARFVGFGAYSLDIELFAYVGTADFNEFLAIREDLLLRIMEVVDASGTGFAFPSQTIYTAKDAGVDAGRSEAAQAEVERLRRAGDLGVPDLRGEQLAALRDRLDWPPPGSATAPRR